MAVPSRQLPLLALVLALALGGRLAAAGLERCPPGCDTDAEGCVRESTTGGYRCIKCLADYVVLRQWGTCGCPRGRYGGGYAEGCLDCPVGSFCPGGNVTEDATNSPSKTDCSTGLTTLGTRAVSLQQCVNLPGHSYAMTTAGAPSATPCPADTFSSGLRKQPSCTPCGPGMTTNTVTSATDASFCLVPPGYYLRTPGVVAPCPRGEWNEGNNLAIKCQACVPGSTTPGEGSDNINDCTVVLPGYYAMTLSGAGGYITATAVCPQNFYCPGGAATAVGDGTAEVAGAQLLACPNGKWTKDMGANSERACLVPPGFSLADTEADTTIQPCNDGEYRADWKFSPAPCDPCGTGILSATTEALQVWHPNGTEMAPLRVRGSSGSCYIRRGQGIYLNPQGSFRAQNCSADSYGVTGTQVYGLSSNPCRDCPAGMQTSASLANSSRFLDATTGGFYSPLACVTTKGKGYNGRVATTCQQGWWNAEGNYGQCTRCPFGLTTIATPLADGSSQDSLDDCFIAPGFGVEEGVVRVCPVGKYNDVVRNDTTSACTPCPTGTTTPDEGASAPVDESCNACASGYGGTAAGCANAALCGGASDATYPGTYGPANRRPDEFACVACPQMTAGFTFDWRESTNAYLAPPVAKSGASLAADCLASYGQIVDGAFYINGTGTASSVAASLEACTDACSARAACMFATYNYGAAANADSCTVFDATDSGTNIVGFKAVPAGDVVQTQGSTRPTALASGRYTFWRTPASFGRVLSTMTGTLLACQEACDSVERCAAISFGQAVTTTAAGACSLLGGIEKVDQGLRTLTRVHVGRLTVPPPV